MHYAFSPVLCETYYITGTGELISVRPLSPISASQATTCTCLCGRNTNTCSDTIRPDNESVMSVTLPLWFTFYHVSISG